MEEALRFFRTYEVWFYLGFGLIGLYYVRKFIIAWQELRAAAFGLERESAQGRVNAAASMLVLVMSLILAEFVLVSFVTPSVPGAVPLLTPTINLLATPTITLQPLQGGEMQEEAVETPEVLTTPTSSVADGCVPGQVMIDSPQPDSELRGIVEVVGTANITNFGFYKLEMKRPDEQNWLTILAGDQIKEAAILGAWNTSLLSPAEYQIALVVVDNKGIAQPPCVIKIRIAGEPQTP